MLKGKEGEHVVFQVWQISRNKIFTQLFNTLKSMTAPKFASFVPCCLWDTELASEQEMVVPRRVVLSVGAKTEGLN